MTAADAPETTTAWDRFDRFAGVLLIAFALFRGIATVLVASATNEPFLVGTVVVAGLAATVINGITAYGLSAGRSWSRPLAVLLLWLAIVIGVLDVAVGLVGGNFLFPFGAIGAALVLRMRPPIGRHSPDGHRRIIGVGLVIAMSSLVLPPVTDYLLQPGKSPVSIAPEALELTANLECGGSGAAQQDVRMIASWTWMQREFQPHGADALAFRWRIRDSQTGASISPWRLTLMSAPGTGFTNVGDAQLRPGKAGASGPYWLGTEGSSGEIVADLSQAAERKGALIEPVMIEIGLQQLRDDQFLMVFTPDGPKPTDASLTFDVGYVHANRWTVWSDPVSCSW